MKLHKFAAALLGSVMIVNTVFAADTLEFKYQPETGKISINGTFAELNSKMLGIMVIPETSERNTIDTDLINSAYLPVKVVKTDTEGVYSDSFYLPDEMEGGSYILYVNYGDREVASEPFMFVNKDELAVHIGELNKKSYEDFEKYYKENYDKLGINLQDILQYESDILGNLYAKKPLNAETFVDLQKKILVLIRIANDENGALQEALEYFGFSLEEYEALSDTIKAQITANIKNSDLKANSPEDVFSKSYILALVTGATNYIELMGNVIKYSDKLALDTSVYDKLSEYNKGLAFKDMFNEKITSFERVVTAFYEYSNKYSQNVSVTPAPGGGGGSGGGGGGASSSYKDNFSVLPVEEKSMFSDISEHWAKKSIEALAGSGIVSGFTDGTFQPDKTVTRAEFTKLLVSALDIPLKYESVFEDVSDSDWYFGYISGANAAGLASGFDGLFNPDNFITREDAAVIIFRAVSGRGISLNGNMEFSDSSQISEYAKNAVSSLAASGIVKGYGDKYSPKGNTTRAEAVVLIERMINLIKGAQ